MLVIRMQRTGRKGHAMFRVVVQDSRRTPTSGKIVANLGSYDPHNKTLIIKKDRAQFYVDHGAQPSERVAGLLKAEGVKLPKWVKQSTKKSRTVRNADKRRSTRPDEPAAETPAAEEPATEAPAAAETETPAAEEPAAETQPDSGEAPADDTQKDADESSADEPKAA